MNGDSLPYDIGAYGPGLIWTRSLDDELVLRAESLGAREITLSAAAPAVPDDLSGLATRLRDLLGLRLLPRRPLVDGDWRVIEGLGQLRYLGHLHDYVEGALHLARMPNLEWLWMPWWKGLHGLDRVSLRGLWLDRWRHGGGLLPVNPARLEAVTLVRPDVEDLRPLAGLTSLKSLVIHGGRRLRSLAGIEPLQALQEVSLESMGGLVDVAGLMACSNLRRVQIQDCGGVESLRLADGAPLEAIWITGSTTIKNGDLRWIGSRAGLKSAVIARRAHYRVDYGSLPKPPVEVAYPSIPDYEYRMPGVVKYEVLLQARFARERLYPAWFRAKHPDLCFGAYGEPRAPE